MKKGSFSTFILILVFFAGLSLLLYPTVSDYWNSLHQTGVVADYARQVADMNNENYKEIWDAAWNYNKSLLEKPDRYHLSDEEKEEYESLLSVGDSDVIGYIKIPVIDCTLPIYHGTDEGVLRVGVGHIEGTSLPVGGESTHCVLSGHRGLPSAKLFTDLDELKVGDTFLLYILDETLTYAVDQIRIVEPDDMEELEIQEGKDLCTLVTCTPYGVNSHRLLVRGHRVANEPASVRITADATQIDTVIVASVLSVPVLVILLIFVLVTTRKKKGKR